MTYGDVLRRFDYDRFVREHSAPCLAVYERISVGNTEIEGDRVIRFDKHAPELPYIDAGFSLMPASTINLLPKSGACSFEEWTFLSCRLASSACSHRIRPKVLLCGSAV